MFNILLKSKLVDHVILGFWVKLRLTFNLILLFIIQKVIITVNIRGFHYKSYSRNIKSYEFYSITQNYFRINLREL